MVTITRNFVKIDGYKTISEVLAIIKDDKNEKNLEFIRKMRKHYEDGNLHTYKTLKEKLPAFIVSGVYEGSFKKEHLNESLKEYSKMVCLDFDNIPKERLDSVKETICASPYTLSCFVSPSGCGLKVICKVSTEREHHKSAYLQLSRHYYCLVGLMADKTCHNIARLCFFSHDPDLYYNEQSQVYEVVVNEMIAYMKQYNEKNTGVKHNQSKDAKSSSGAITISYYFKPIEGYHHCYDVSNDGRVRSKSRSVTNKNGRNRRIRQRTLKPRDNGSGYKFVTLCKNGKNTRFYVHRLVAEAFIANPNNYTQVNHKDGNPSNNHVDNLEWVSPSQNAKHAYDTGLNKNKGSEH